jgi:hypothetical protein
MHYACHIVIVAHYIQLKLRYHICACFEDLLSLKVIYVAEYYDYYLYYLFYSGSLKVEINANLNEKTQE